MGSRPYRQADSRRRDFTVLDSFPARLVSVGDAVASFSRAYGPGISAAALHASCLSDYLHAAPPLDRGGEPVLRATGGRDRRRVDPLGW